MDGLIATVDQLAARLGMTLTPETTDYARAELSLWEVSVRARSIAGKSWETPGSVPEAVVAVVLAAAYRAFKNPDRYIMNQAGGLQAQLAAGEFSGDIFLREERSELLRHRAKTGMWTLTTTRGELNNSMGFTLVTNPNGSVGLEPFPDDDLGMFFREI